MNGDLPIVVMGELGDGRTAPGGGYYENCGLQGKTIMKPEGQREVT